MLFRTILLLFSTSLVALESSKINEILQKKVGKRFENDPMPPTLYEVRDSGHGLGWRTNWLRKCDLNCEYSKMSPAYIERNKRESALTILALLNLAASKENEHYYQASSMLESYMLTNLTAVVCEEKGEGSKKMNRYQYMKYRHQTAGLFQATPRVQWHYQILNTTREILRFTTDIVQIDKKFNLNAHIHYDITMNFEPRLRKKGSYFSLAHISQGGVCPENGVLVYDQKLEQNGTIDDLEELKNHPTAKTLIGFFTPLADQMTDPEERYVPKFWITGIEKGHSKFYICQDQVEEPKEYTEDQFLEWFRRFEIMWHPEKEKKDDFISINVLDIKPESITAIITMKLQLGLGEKFYDWNFRVQGAKNTSIANSTWYIDRLEVPCNTEFHPKDESFGAIGDVIATTFVEDLVELPDPTQWYSTVAFVNRLTKKGLERFQYCDQGILLNRPPLLDKFIFDRNILHVSNFTKYWIDHKDVTTPAPDSGFIAFRTISSQTRDTKLEYENEWKFKVQWDPIDHFYYVIHMDIGCHKPINDGKYDEGVKYIDINYGI